MKNTWQSGAYVGQNKIELIRISSTATPPFNRYMHGHIDQQWIEKVVAAMNAQEQSETAP